jgi:hypothetical protein
VLRCAVVSADSLIVLTKRSAYALRFGDRGGRRSVSTPAAANVSPNATQGVAEPWIAIMKEEAFPSQTSINRVAELATALDHPALSGSGRMPAISTRRVARSITNRTAKRVSPRAVQTSTVKKSAAASTPRCVLRNSFQVVRFCCPGAGSIPRCLRMLGTMRRSVSERRSGFLRAPKPRRGLPIAPAVRMSPAAIELLDTTGVKRAALSLDACLGNVAV